METKINNTNQDLAYLAAVKSIEGRGRLPTNLELDEIINDPANKQEFERLKNAGYFRAWSSTIPVYRSPGVPFKKGEDIIHTHPDDQGRNYILPAKYIPKEAIGKSGIALVFDYKRLEEKNGKVIIHPGKITIQTFPDEDGWYEVNKETGIPIDVPSSSSNKDARYLYRLSGDSLRPVSRGGDFGVRRIVDCLDWFNDRLGVGWVADKQTAETKTLTEVLKKNPCKHAELGKVGTRYRCRKCKVEFEVS